MRKRIDNNIIAGLAILSALSVVLSLLIHFPLFPAAGFLEYDPADIPIFLATFMYGPWLGLLVTGIVSILQGITVSSASGFIGILMHFLMTGSYVVVAGCIYRHFRTLRGALVSMLFGFVVWIAMSVVTNIIFTPLFMNVTRAEVIHMIMPVILPFNVLKAAINSLVTFLSYKRMKQLFDKVAAKTKKRDVSIGRQVITVDSIADSNVNANNMDSHADSDNSKDRSERDL